MIALMARTLFEMPIHRVEELPFGNYTVEYENGDIVEEHNRSILFNRHCWELIKPYPNTPLTPKCSSIVFLGSGHFNTGTTTKFLESIFNHVCDENSIRYYKDKEPLLRLVYVTANRIYNEIIQKISSNVTTIDATDFVKVIQDEEIVELHSKLINTPDSVEGTYRGIRKYMNDGTRDNRFIRAYRAKAINENQANQCIGPRGFVTTLDRTVYKRAIMNGFIRGMGSLYEIMAESLTAAKSLNANETHISTSEYASRRVQLLTMVVKSVTNVDCRSNRYLNFLVTDKILPNLKGKWYLPDNETKLKPIKGNEVELIGKTIQMRSALYCNAPDRATICTKCLGRISENFKENSNLGYIMTSNLMEKLTQSILSTKHLTHSVKKSAIKLFGEALKYFQTGDGNEIYLKDDLDLTKMDLILPAQQLNKLTDVLSLTHTRVELNKIGEMEVVGVRTTSPQGQLIESVNVSYRDRKSTMTAALLNHVKSSNYEIDQRGNYVVPLINFPVNEAIFENPLKEANIISFVNKTSSIIEVMNNSKHTLEEHFFHLVNSVYDQLDCNITLLEVIVYATTSFNEAEGNFRLGRNSPNMKQTKRSLLFRNRSIGQLLVFETQKNELIKQAPRIFSEHYRSDHPLDALFVPQNIVK